MMDEQNLAARLDATPLYEGCGDASDLPERAANELRRQHAEIERLTMFLVTIRDTGLTADGAAEHAADALTPSDIG